jgi:hypothetical protein
MAEMDRIEASGFSEFDRLAVLFRRTRELLDVATATGDLPDDATEVLATETLAHVEDIEQGFRVWLRAGTAELTELRALIGRAGMLAGVTRSAAEARAALVETMHEIALTEALPELVPAPARALAAIQHARLVFALLPATPEGDVHFPVGRRTYADILPPRGAAELAERIEELERSVWAVATTRRPRLRDGSYRRTYGFFDTAARISGSHFLTA